MTHPHIRAFLFDLDGVITDTAEYHYLAWKKLAAEEGIPFSRSEADAMRGLSRRDSLRVLLKNRPLAEETAQAWMLRKNDTYLQMLEQLTPDSLLPGVRRLLTEARDAGIHLAVASASRNAHLVLDRLGVLPLFDAVGDGHSVVNPKPAPDLFLWTAGRLNANPRQAVVFEDARAGVDAALAGGFWVVGIGTAVTSERAHIHVADLSDVTVTSIVRGLTVLSD
ncbi:MAG: beta-phosphoglucomutase [Anaerolineae bacterium]|nr:beta-phosphoglucomutase [Anaerolineae bacterium]